MVSSITGTPPNSVICSLAMSSNASAGSKRSANTTAPPRINALPSSSEMQPMWLGGRLQRDTQASSKRLLAGEGAADLLVAIDQIAVRQQCALGLPGRARGVDDYGGGVRVRWGGVQGLALAVREQLRERAADAGKRFGKGDDLADGSFGGDRTQILVKSPAFRRLADRDQDLGCAVAEDVAQLRQPVTGVQADPDGADPLRRHQDDGKLGPWGCEHRHPVADPDAGALQRRGAPLDQPVEGSVVESGFAEDEGLSVGRDLRIVSDVVAEAGGGEGRRRRGIRSCQPPWPCPGSNDGLKPSLPAKAD